MLVARMEESCDALGSVENGVRLQELAWGTMDVAKCQERAQ